MLAKDSSDLPFSATQALDCLVQLRVLQIALRYDAFGGLVRVLRVVELVWWTLLWRETEQVCLALRSPHA